MGENQERNVGDVTHSYALHTKPKTNTQGDPVRIRSGPLRDLEAVFEFPLLSADRVRILLEVMGRMATVEIDYSDLVPL